VYSSATGEIISPGYGKDKTYPPKSQCQWTIRTDADHEINLKFIDFKLESHSECRYDFVTVKNAQVDQREQYCGEVSPNGKNSQRLIKSAGDELIINFKSDTSKQERGFRARWWTTRKSSVTASGELYFIFLPDK